MSSEDNQLLVTMVAIGIGILIVNTILLILHMKQMKHQHQRDDRYYYQEEYAAPNAEAIFSNVKTSPDDVGQMRQVASCTSYGVKNNQNMPFNNESSLYR
jgi:hypothetical protein